jgi:chromosome condensin MukBEF ATPase and DNA-binding subunit MukB
MFELEDLVERLKIELEQSQVELFTERETVQKQNQQLAQIHELVANHESSI